ncbi:hypothetical protein R1sor_009766 [Riccia sorocarpa]|uniref:Uncharacterized protein n=1 Tax=Riccia sorocarpa TaxID=122646 RepID=A0ABD3I017_9MARC
MEFLNLLLIVFVLFFPTALATDDRIPGSVFIQDKETAVLQSAPFWFFGRSLNREPCYPEDAAPNGKQNPGTSVPLTLSPGAGCPSPGNWNGTYSLGNPFPTYWAMTYCPDDASWRINYNLYFSHDGMGGIGHKHDWEWVAAIWKSCDEGNDLWCRVRLIRSFHRTPKSEDWGSIQNTINSKDEIRHLGDKNKHHPLIYVGAFKHAMFDTRKTTVNIIGADDDEFRSNDWWYFAGDFLVDGSVIDRAWDYGAASSTPLHVMDEICSK